MGKYLDLAKQVDLHRRQAPPPDTLGEPCPACGAKDKWRWLGERLLCRACLIQDNPSPAEAPATATASPPGRPRPWW